MQPPSMRVDRRALMRHAILLVGGNLLARPAVALAEPDARFLSDARFALLDEFCETMIPRTDTPGARDAGVPLIIDSLMRDWASAERARAFERLLDDLDLTTRQMHGVTLAILPQERKLEAASAFDAARIGAGDPAYSKLKELVLTAYYLSEPGATQELRYELVPGAWKAGVPVGPETRAWAV